jgi:hypothetical protein
MSVTHLPPPVGATFPGTDAPVDASKATRRRALAGLGILAAATLAVIVANASPGDATPASCSVVDHTWPTALDDTQPWPSRGQSPGDHAFSQPGVDTPWASSGPTLIWPSEHPTVPICS